jgi:hypothetical protein
MKGALVGLTITAGVCGAGAILATEPTARTICGGVLIAALIGLCWLTFRTDKAERVSRAPTLVGVYRCRKN